MSEAQTRRQLCAACGRPCRVCLCSSLPATPLRLGGLLLVLQHPHEAKRKLATVPVVQKCLEMCAVVRDRRLLPGRYLLVDQLVAAAAAGQLPLFVLYPGPGAVALQPAAAARGLTLATGSKQSAVPPVAGSAPCCQAPSHGTLATGAPAGAPDGRQPLATLAGLQYVLLVIDGTWHQAREMFQVLEPWLLQPAGPAVQVALPTCGLTATPAGTTGATDAEGNAEGADHGEGSLLKVAPPAAEHQAAEQAQDMEPHHALVQQFAGLAAAHHSGGGCVEHSRGSDAECSTVPQPNPAHTAAGPAVQPPSVAHLAASASGVSAIGGDVSDPWCRLRTQPAEGCMTTMEATARALAALEGAAAGQRDGGVVLEVLLKPLRRMTALQAQWDPAVAARTGQALQQ